MLGHSIMFGIYIRKTCTWYAALPSSKAESRNKQQQQKVPKYMYICRCNIPLLRHLKIPHAVTKHA